LKPSTGVLFLVLPLRCVNSKHVGGQVRFEALLAAMGFSHLIEMRFTPRLVFYVLGRDKAREGKAEGEAAAIEGEGTLDVHTDVHSRGKVEIKVGTGVGAISWKHLVQSAFLKHSHVQKARGGKSVRTEDYFCKDFSAVPCSEFCLSMATVLDREGDREGDGKTHNEKEKGQAKNKGLDRGGQAKKKRKER
jgi:25S rRNA (adenine(2142)-N(1))-methyltransferase, Bmt2